MPAVLPYELLLLQNEALELSESVFALPGELVLDAATSAFLPSLRTWIEAGGDGGIDELVKQDAWTDELAFQVNIDLEHPDPTNETPFPLSLSIKIPLVQPSDGRETTPDGAPFAALHLQQPPWLARTPYDALAASLPSPDTSAFSSSSELILAAVEHIREEAVKLIPTEPDPPSGKDDAGKPGAPEFRVWMWFPSLSTKEKRDDMVNWAADYDLTGFVLAGKPAMLCVEGAEQNIQTYLAEIKARSWADIPSFQKKVSERYRSPLLPPSVPSDDKTAHRIFTSMSEITSLIPRGGFRGNRPEMGVVRDYLEELGLGEAFGLIIGGGQFS
ncbi:hypothetical protein JCM8097_008412 [Rhodosporidiobolus ruineniae]